MAFRRRWQKRRSRRPRSRRAIRSTTEQGTGRWERSFFNFGVDQPVSDTPEDATNDAVQLVTGSAFLAPAGLAGSQSQALARLMQQPQKGWDVLAVTYDLECFMDPGMVQFAAPPGVITTFEWCLQGGHALWSNRTGIAGGTPVSIPPFYLSQFPINQAAPTASEEDADYALRTHFQRSWTLSPDFVQVTATDDSQYVRRGWQRFRLSRTVRIKRRFTDTQGLYFSFWNFTPAGWNPAVATTVQWRVTGSLWYRLVW